MSTTLPKPATLTAPGRPGSLVTVAERYGNFIGAPVTGVMSCGNDLQWEARMLTTLGLDERTTSGLIAPSPGPHTPPIGSLVRKITIRGQRRGTLYLGMGAGLEGSPRTTSR